MSCAEPLVPVIYGMASEQKYSSGKKKKKKLDDEKHSQDKGKVCFNDVGGGASLNAD